MRRRRKRERERRGSIVGWIFSFFRFWGLRDYRGTGGEGDEGSLCVF